MTKEIDYDYEHSIERREGPDYSKENPPEIQPNYSITDNNSDTTAIGDANDVQQINDAIDILEKTDKGRDISSEIRRNHTSIKFDDINAVAQYDPTQNEISINEELRDADPSILAAHLAHEGTHVQWYSQGLTDSIDQEYHAFKNEKEVWDQVKDENTDEQCDWVSSMIDQGEADAKMQIRLMYRHLPEYA